MKSYQEEKNVCHMTAISSLAGNLVQQGVEQQMEVPVAEGHTSIPYKLFKNLFRTYSSA